MKNKWILAQNMKTKTLERIAAKHLGVKTLKTRNRDSLDFYDLSVWRIKEALEKAYEAGKKHAKPA